MKRKGRVSLEARPASMWMLFPGAAARGAAEIVAASGAGEEVTFVYDELASGVDLAGVSAYFEALEHGVVDAHVVGGGADGVFGVGVPEDDVGVAAGGDGSLLRIHAEDLCRGGRGDFDEAVEGEAAGVDAMMVDQLHPVFDAGAAVGDFGEVVLAEGLLVGEAKGAVVGGDNLQVIVLEAVPELLLVFLFAQRRREDVFRVFEGFAGHLVFDGEQEILRAGFGEGGQAAVARFANLVEGVFAGEMHDVDGGSGDFGHGDGALHGFGLGDGGAGERVVDGSGFARGERLLHEHVDDAAVFGVHADEGSVLRGLLKGAEDGGVIHHEHAGVSHEELEAGYALANHRVHVFEAGRGQVGDDHVQAVVDGGFSFGLAPPSVERGAHFSAAGLDGEVDDGGGSADGCGFRAGFEVVGGEGSAEGHVEVGVGIDSAGENEEPGCVDDFVTFGRNAGADFADGGTIDEDVGGSGGFGGDYGAVLDQ